VSTPLLSDWESIRQAGQQQVGGKAWNLARLARYRFPVPNGVVIPSECYRQWLHTSGLEAELLASSDQPDSLIELSARLGEQPLQLDLSGLPEGALAVRSSAPQEDTADASFAGIHSSCLNVSGAEAVVKAIRDVWLSLWTAAAIAYRERIGLAHQEASMAVLIMPLIPAQASGIAFSRDPVSGRDDRMVIHAVRGLGESLVNGQVNGDEIILAEDLADARLLIQQVTPGNQTLRTDPVTGGGTETCATEPDPTAVLQESQTLELGEQIRLAAFALDYTKPDFDLEWAWDGEQFWLLQARPITAAGRCTYPELRAQPDIWSRGNTRDVVPEPLSPIDWGGSRRLVNAILKQGFQTAGLALYPGVQRAALFHGKLYLNLSVMQWEAYAALGITPEAMNHLVGGHQPEISTPAKTLRRRLQNAVNMIRFLVKAPRRRRAGRKEVASAMVKATALRSEPLPQDDREYARMLRHLMRFSHGVSDVHFLQGAAGGALNFLVDAIEACLPGKGHALAAALMTAGPASVTAQQGYDLIEVARLAVAEPSTRSWLEQRRNSEARNWQELPEGNAFRLDFSAFLQRYGHRGIYETYTRNPRWREQPDYLLDSLIELAETDLETQKVRNAKAADHAYRQVHQALPWWKRPILKGLIRDAKAGSNEREAARSALIAILEVVRRALLALGARLANQSYINKPEEIFFLLQFEIIALLEGILPPARLKPLIADRQQSFEEWLREEAPDVILRHPNGGITEQADIDATPQDSNATFHGVPVGTGAATGTARLLTSPEQGERLARGDILVVPSTDPAWTPLFLKAGGLIMETGGYLSHGAIVAREFGIPAVVNLPGILQQIVDGEKVEVNGTNGTVRKLKS
jgi:pyruvate,water dikinase